MFRKSSADNRVNLWSGLAFARCLCERGALVVINGRDHHKLRSAMDSLKIINERVAGYAFDITDPAATKTAIEAIVGEHGPIDILVNNAGINIRAPLHEFADEDWDKVIGINLTGTYQVSKEVAPNMIRQKQGKIINICSMQGDMGVQAEPSQRTVVYPYSPATGIKRRVGEQSGPHQHSNDLEDIYCYFDIPKPQAAFHFASRKAGVFEHIHPVSTGDFVVIPEGYHPTCGMPGVASCYFWIMAAFSKKSRRYDLAVNEEPVLRHVRLDELHGYAHGAWRALGSPDTLPADMYRVIAAHMDPVMIDHRETEELSTLHLQLPPSSVSMVIISDGRNSTPHPTPEIISIHDYTGYNGEKKKFIRWEQVPGQIVRYHVYASYDGGDYQRVSPYPLFDLGYLDVLPDGVSEAEYRIEVVY